MIFDIRLSSYSSDMAEFSCVTFNANGLNIPSKRSRILKLFHRNKVDILLLQETHFKKSYTPVTKHNYYTHWFNACSPAQRRKGVSIVFNKHVQFTKTDIIADPDGRFLFLKGNIGGRIFTFANVYAPNDKQIPFFKMIFTKLDPFVEGTLILGGDFNLPLNPELDTSQGKTRISLKNLRVLKKTLQRFHLVDVWRAMNPTVKDFSYFSKIHQTYSRIDYILITQRDLGLIRKIEYEQCIFSDHAPLRATFKFGPNLKTPGVWRLNESLLAKKENIEILNTHLNNFFKENNEQSGCNALTWETHKAVIRGILIQIGSREKKARQKEIEDILHKIRQLEIIHKTSINKQTEGELMSLRLSLKNVLDRQSQRYLFMAKYKNYLYANKCGKALASLVRKTRTVNAVSKIKPDPLSGIETFDTKKIIKCFKTFYSELYNLNTGRRDRILKEGIDEYLKDLRLPELTQDQLDQLSSPFTLKEITTAINSLKLGKSPGPDGFSAGYYKKFKEILAPQLQQYFNGVSFESPFRSESLLAHISVIPKEGKDITLCQNYRPISLLNVDIKIYAKLLAERLRKLMNHLIDPDQVGFIPGREAKDNTVRAFHLIQTAKIKKIPLIFVTTDAEKAFDRLNWTYLHAVLQKFNFPQTFIDKILSLYVSPSACVKVNGFLSSPFNISNGTRQGCPLSPLLFVLCLEPFLTKIRTNPKISGIRTKHKDHKISAYADDTLFTLSDPLNSLPELIREFEYFNKVSDFKINLNKSEIFNATTNTNTWDKVTSLSPLKVAPSSFKYLGIKICRDLSETYSSNFVPLLKQTESMLKEWSTYWISWFGRINLIKMEILPRFLYYFQTIPVEIPPAFFKKIKQLITKFIWQNKQNRIRHATLIRHSRNGGIGLPNFELYYKATILTRALEWSNPHTYKNWVELEQDSLKVNLITLLWKAPQYTKNIALTRNQITKITIKKWHNINKSLQIHSQIGTKTPLSSFIPHSWGELTKLMRENKILGKTPVRNFLKHGSLIPLDEFNKLCGSRAVSVKQYSLLSAMINKWYNDRAELIADKPLISLFQNDLLRDHLVSRCYRILNVTDGHPPHFDKWNVELGKNFSADQIEYMLKKSLTFSQSYIYQEMHYKLITRWYKTPILMHRINQAIPECCWRCKKEIGNYVHIWFTCPLLVSFWDSLNKIVNEVFHSEVTFTVELVMFYLFDVNQADIKSNLCIFFLNAAKILIPRKWLQEKPPTVAEWLLEVQKIQDFEKLKWTLAQDLSKYDNTWNIWTNYLTPGKYKQLIQELS